MLSNFSLKQHMVEFIRGTGVVTDGVTDSSSLNGPFSWTVPPDVAQLLADGCGAGASGGGGGAVTGTVGRAGGGGGGCGSNIMGAKFPVNATEVLTITLGAGGAASAPNISGHTGGTTSIIGTLLSLFLSGGFSVVPGASSSSAGTAASGSGGGISSPSVGGTGAAGTNGGPGGSSTDNGPTGILLGGSRITQAGGGGGSSNGTASVAGGNGGNNFTPGSINSVSDGYYSSFLALGGTGTTTGTISLGGGGAGANCIPFGVGGAGGNGGSNAGPVSGFGSGGGGGGGGASSSAGGDGYVRITYWSMDT